MAKEYIDKNLTWKALDVDHLFDNGNPRHIAQQVVEAQPTADVVEVVRCKDCVSHTHCFIEDHFKFAGLENPFCCVGKKVE